MLIEQPKQTTKVTALQPAESRRRFTDSQPHPILAREHWLIADSSSSNLVNFPFAFTVFVASLAGSVVTFFGVCLGDFWLAAFGFAAALAGFALCGWSLFDTER